MGGGWDFYLTSSLTLGQANIGSSYGDRAMAANTAYQQSLTGTGGFNNWTVGKMETFTMTAGLYEPLSGGGDVVVEPVDQVVPPTAVSAPVMGGGLMLAMGFLGMRQRKKTLHST
jgi:hypothetical protein